MQDDQKSQKEDFMCIAIGIFWPPGENSNIGIQSPRNIFVLLAWQRIKSQIVCLSQHVSLSRAKLPNILYPEIHEVDLWQV